MINPSANEEFINFPVPRRHYAAVVQALAKAMEDENTLSPTSSTSASASVEESEPVGQAQIDWTAVDNFKRLRRELRAPAAITMLDLTAARPGQFVPFEEIVQASGRGNKQARADLGALTKAIKRGFGVSREESKWPVEAQWSAGGEQQVYYMMSDDIAEAWKNSATS